MNQTILFSPVGGTDPISSTNCRDGSMLHICRVYKPDKVYLYMSREMLDFQGKDNRFQYCLDELCKLQGRVQETEVIERGNLRDVQKFDYFYEDFRELLNQISKNLDSSDTLLLNVSSGTPAMKSGLLVLAVLGEFPVKLVQVSTPEHKINEHVHKDYDVVTLWELNEDNEETFQNRCEEIQCPTLSKIRDEEMLKKHIGCYDYPAALELAKRIPGAKDSYVPLLEAAQARGMLNLSAAEKIMCQQQVNFIPVKSGYVKLCFEYALNLDVKRKRKEYADFIRAITPLLADLFELILKKECKITVDNYCRQIKSRRVWDRAKLMGTEIDKALKARFPDFRYGDIYSIHLVTLIHHFSSNQELKTLAEGLRGIEEGIRNLAAHEIVSVTEDTIKQKTNKTSADIMDMIKRAFGYTGTGIKSGCWDSYENMNQEIINRIGCKDI